MPAGCRFLHLAGEHLEQLVNRERLLEDEVEILAADGFHLGEIVNAGEEDEWRVPVIRMLPEFLVELDAGHFGHPHIGYHHIDGLPVKQRKGLQTVWSDHDGMTQTAHHFLEHFQVFGLVFNSKNAHGRPFAGG